MLIDLYLQGRLDLGRFVSEKIDIDGVEDVPTIARPEKEAPSSSSGGGAWLAVAIVVILVVAAAGAVFLLPMFGVELPFELPFEHPLAPKK